MATKKNNKYTLHLQEIEKKDGSEANEFTEFDIENHDDILKLLNAAKGKLGFKGDNESVEFILGIKLFGEVILRNRKNPLFEEFQPAFAAFMKNLKSNMVPK